MSIFLPVAGISINIWILIAAGCLVGFLSGLLGVGGGFLLTPILTYMPLATPEWARAILSMAGCAQVAV